MNYLVYIIILTNIWIKPGACLEIGCSKHLKLKSPFVSLAKIPLKKTCRKLLGLRSRADRTACVLFSQLGNWRCIKIICHGNPQPSFLGVISYNPYIGGLKPSFFMVLGSKGVNQNVVKIWTSKNQTKNNFGFTTLHHVTFRLISYIFGSFVVLYFWVKMFVFWRDNWQLAKKTPWWTECFV